MTDYKITGSPEVIWLNYGDIERDDTHQNCAKDGDVTWCEEVVFYSDIKYVRADLIESLRQQLAERDAEIERLKTVPMKYRRMAFNAQLQDENAQLSQQLDQMRQQLAAKQAEVDALMLEYCPNEMSQEQLDNWAAHQRPAKEN